MSTSRRSRAGTDSSRCAPRATWRAAEPVPKACRTSSGRRAASRTVPGALGVRDHHLARVRDGVQQRTDGAQGGVEVLRAQGRQVGQQHGGPAARGARREAGADRGLEPGDVLGLGDDPRAQRGGDLAGARVAGDHDDVGHLRRGGHGGQAVGGHRLAPDRSAPRAGTWPTARPSPGAPRSTCRPRGRSCPTGWRLDTASGRPTGWGGPAGADDVRRGGAVAGPRRTVAFRFAEAIVRPLVRLLTRHEWRGREHVPLTGGCVVVVNHTSHADPFVVAHYLINVPRLPRFLGKESVFRIPVAGRILRSAGQIPVYRETADASAVLQRGGRRRAGRGVRRHLPRGHADPRPRPVADARQDRCRARRPRDRLPRRPARAVGRAPGAVALRQGPAPRPAAAGRRSPPARRSTCPRSRTDPWTPAPCSVPRTRSWTRLSVLVGQLRDAEPPTTRWDPRQHGQTTTGDFRKGPTP